MINWGIVSTGRIASTFAKGLATSKTGKLVAIASRTQAEANRFGIEKHGDFLKGVDVKRYGSHEAMLADKQVQAVYIATPHPQHLEWVIKAAEAGKHILVEKPIGLNHAEAMIAVEAARKAGVFLMEAFMYRCHPTVIKIVELIKSGAIGQVRAMQANFAFNASPPNYESRTLKNALGGGGILDVGCYPTTFVRMAAGAAFGKDAAAEPVELKALGHIGPTGVDEYAAAVLKFQNPSDTSHEIIAHIATGVQITMDNTARVYGTNGSILMHSWIPKTADAKITLFQNGKEPQDINVDPPQKDATAYTLEADVLANAVAQGQKQATFPAMSWSDTLGNMKTLDAWRAQIGQVYDAEKPENLTKPLGGRVVTKAGEAAGGAMTYGKLPGVNKPISRQFMGVDNQIIDEYPHAVAMFDDYVLRGGNAFDTAYIYRGGRAEKSLGQWQKQRGIREQIVILGKGAHTPNCNPPAITSQLKESLERLQTDYVDIYMMHRDNPAIPVGEFVDVLNEHLAAGRMKAIGGSNWTLERAQAFNDYAKKNGKTGFAALSNNLSLARMMDPVWAGCITANDPAWLEWHKKTQVALLSWSSQARGFFVHGDPNYTADAELVRCWYSPENFARLARAKELAKKKGVAPLQINMAWVLTQEFPTFALIGPRSIEETRTSMEGLAVKLTADEVKWLLNG